MADVNAVLPKPESTQQSKAKRRRSALGRARRALAPRPALRATVARRLRSGRARPAATHRPRGSIHHLGSPRVVVRVRTGANGAAEATTVRTIDYDEFGNQTVTWNTGAISDQALPIGFAGGLYDQDTGFVHFGARDNDPSVGRWISKDPILFGGMQSNLYVYVGNDPINRGDPSGLRDWSDSEVR